MISILVLEVLLLSDDKKFSDHIGSILSGTKESLRLYHNIDNNQNGNDDF